MFTLGFCLESVSVTRTCMGELGCVPLEDDSGRWVAGPQWVVWLTMVVVVGCLFCHMWFGYDTEMWVLLA